MAVEYLFSEFDSWKNENQALYDELREHETVLSDRFYPVFAVLEHIESQVREQKMAFDEDLRKIFDVGLAFLHDQFETCKMYLETNFKGDLHAFLDFETVVHYILYVEDVRYELREKAIEYDEQSAEDLFDFLEEILVSHKWPEEDLGLFVDDRIRVLVGDHAADLYGIIDIFNDVAETLGLFLYEDDDLVIGKDL